MKARTRCARIAIGAILMSGIASPPAFAQGYGRDYGRGDLTYDSRSYGRPYDDRRRGDPRDLDDRRASGDPRGTLDEEIERRAPWRGAVPR